MNSALHSRVTDLATEFSIFIKMDKKIKKILGPPEGFKLTKEWI